MTQLVNPVRARLEAGGMALGVGIRLARSVEIATIFKHCGYDWLFIDLEHGPLSLDVAAQICVAAYSAGICPMVRVPENRLDLAARALDSGAVGIVMPHVDTAAQASSIVSQLRFAPAGQRSNGGPVPHFGYRVRNIRAESAAFNAGMLIVAMLESRAAIANVDEIAAVDGIDVLLVGMGELALEVSGGDYDSPEIASAFDAVIDACRRHKKWPGMAALGPDSVIRKYIARGVRVIIAGTDISCIIAGASQRAALLRSMITN